MVASAPASASAPAPAPSSRPRKLAYVASGARSTFVVRSDGAVWAWGTFPDPKGGADVTWARPARIDPLHDVVRIAAGTDDVFAVLRDGTALAWGNTFGFALARGNYALPEMEAIAKMDTFTGVADIQYEERWGCARQTDGAVFCWGMRDAESNPLARVPALGSAQAFSVGSEQACAIRTNLTVGCWGLVHGRL